MNLASALLVAISANLDTFAVAISYGLKKVKLNIFSILLISLITSIGTFISMSLGLAIVDFISLSVANTIGSFMLIGMGIWFIFDHFKEEGYYHEHVDSANSKGNTYCQILSDPIKADKDNSGTIDYKECIALSVALSLNNVGLGIAASIAGINIYLNTTFTFIITILGFTVGGYIGRSYLSKFCNKYASLASGILIILIGLYEMFI